MSECTVFSLGFSTVFAFPGAASLIRASLLSTMTLSYVSATLVHLTFLHFEIYFPLQLYFSHLIFNTFCSVCLCTPRGHVKLLSYSLSFKLFLLFLLLFNVFWRVNEHSWYSIILISEFLLLNDSQLNTDHMRLLRFHLSTIILVIFNWLEPGLKDFFHIVQIIKSNLPFPIFVIVSYLIQIYFSGLFFSLLL